MKCCGRPQANPKVGPVEELDLALASLGAMFDVCSDGNDQHHHQGVMKARAAIHIISVQAHLNAYLTGLAEAMRDELPEHLTCGLDKPWGERTPPIEWLMDAFAQIVDPGVSMRIDSSHAIDNDVSEDEDDFRGDR